MVVLTPVDDVAHNREVAAKPNVGARIRSYVLRNPWLAPVGVALISTMALHLVERTFRLVSPQVLKDGFMFQDWSSNWTMQTMGLEDMLPFGPKALWYEHVYPPFLDAVRFLLMLPETNAGQPPSAMVVDFRLYAINAVYFGIINAIVYLWVRDLTRSGWWALGVTFLWAISPGYLTAMLLLEPTPPALLFITASFYFLYRFLKTRHLGYATGFFAMFLLASTTRNVSQPHVLAIVIAALITFWFIASKRSWWILALNILLVGLTCVLPAKQLIMYDTLDTSTYSGYHRAGMLWIDPRTVPDAEYPQDIIDNALVFSSRYNTQETLKDNYRLTKAANDYLLTQPIDSIRNLGRSLTITVPEMLRPTSMYTQNYLVERIPWRSAFDWVFSSWRYILLTLAAILVVGKSRGGAGARHLIRRYGWFLVFYALVAAPVLWSNRYFPGQEDLGPTWTDAVRLKVFLEAPLFIFISYAIWTLTPSGRRRLNRSRPEIDRSTHVGRPDGDLVVAKG